MDLSYALNKEILFFDYMQEIINYCLNKNFDDVEEDFNELESIVNNENCLNIIKEAKSIFYTIKEKITNPEDYTNSLKTLNKKLIMAYDTFRKN